MLVFAILSHITAQAQSGGVPVWTNRFNGLGNNYDFASAIAVDGSGNVFVTGYSEGIISGDYSTIKYSGAGVALWTNRYNDPNGNYNIANAMAVDRSGNVFVTGNSSGGGLDDYATIAYSGGGVALWTNRYNGPGDNFDKAKAVAVDDSGNVFVTGFSDGVFSSLDYATIKYSGVGVALWTNRYNGPVNGTDVANAMAVDGSGNVFVTGSSTGSTYDDYATIKYSSAGVALWTKRYNGPGSSSDEANAIAVDSGGNVFVTGDSIDSDSSHEYATIKYSGAGAALWTNRYSGPGNRDIAQAIVVDGSDNVIVTGNSVGSGSSYDYTTIKYSGAGVALWTNRYNGPGNGYDQTSAIAVDRSGNVFVTGYSIGIGVTNDYATIAYSRTGVPLWTNRYNGPDNDYDQALAMAVDSGGNVFVTGQSYGGGSSYDYATIKYSAVPPSLSVALTPMNTVVVSWPSASTGFTLQSTTNLVSPAVWNNNLPSPVVINGQNTVTNPISGTQQFFRLSQ
jgi:hypothetical protein